jgi:hypothetical protein
VAVPASLVGAADPPHPTYVDEDATPPILTPIVDGDVSEWDFVLDRFSDMLQDGGSGGQTEVLTKLQLRYNCDSGVLYALVVQKGLVTIDADGPLDAHFISFGDGVKLVDGTDSPPDGVPPDFAFVGQTGGIALGWEASLYVPPGTYTDFNVQTSVNYAGGIYTSQVPGGAIDLVIDCSVPSSVNLSFFGARALPDKVMVGWQTASEVDNVGFNLYRAESADGPRVQLNQGLMIPSQAPGSGSGADYRYADEDVKIGKTYYYWLEDVDIYGVSTQHGPVKVVFGLLDSTRTIQPRPGRLAPSR